MNKILVWALLVVDTPCIVIIGGVCGQLIAPAILCAAIVYFKWRCSAFTMIGMSDEPFCSPTP